MAICGRCGGSGKLIEGTNPETQNTRYMTCEVCWGSGHVDRNRDTSTEGCAVFMLALVSGFLTILGFLVWP